MTSRGKKFWGSVPIKIGRGLRKSHGAWLEWLYWSPTEGSSRSSLGSSVKLWMETSKWWRKENGHGSKKKKTTRSQRRSNRVGWRETVRVGWWGDDATHGSVTWIRTTSASRTSSCLPSYQPPFSHYATSPSNINFLIPLSLPSDLPFPPPALSTLKSSRNSF